ncbi:TOBE domain protein [Arcobacter nitrofigilis DSM 7299]|uniref:TOBE domain protein n=1 Tax=Arcobacter nitrofigilis (strain ATCC 33309 / DSM 7299 / CCUG 15893 / LMG 7604 / NCTC 12251 / CI) TaxID=572480 RepID=D5V3K4_ARCNC|nr:TOBE domain-containing protein [Arcobacter nitrofigilis]ADG91715.1 TOBE domain protein [Arcobacter nitrofigilis DSM 7299]
MKLSARNQLTGVIELVEQGQVNSEIYVKLNSGYTIVSVITNNAVKNLDLKIDDIVTVIFKSSCVLITTDVSLNISARNKLQGSVENIYLGSVTAEVEIDIGNKERVIAVITASSIKNLHIKIGNSVSAIIKATDVMIGK